MTALTRRLQHFMRDLLRAARRHRWMHVADKKDFHAFDFESTDRRVIKSGLAKKEALCLSENR